MSVYAVQHFGNMEPAPDLTRRREVWELLSELFLDTELLPDDFRRIAAGLHNSGFVLQELESMLRCEVAPVLGGNLFSVAGVWDAFDLWPVERRYQTGKTRPSVLGQAACRLVRNDWERVKVELAKLEATA